MINVTTVLPKMFLIIYAEKGRFKNKVENLFISVVFILR